MYSRFSLFSRNELVFGAFILIVVIILLNKVLSKVLSKDKYYTIPQRSLTMNIGDRTLLPTNSFIKRYIVNNYKGKENLQSNDIVITNVIDKKDGNFTFTFYLDSDIPIVENFITMDLIEGADNPGDPNQMTPNQWCDPDAFRDSINSEYPGLLVPGSSIQCDTTYFKSSHLSTCGFPQEDGYGIIYNTLNTDEYDKTFINWELTDALNQMKEDNPQQDMCGNSPTEDPKLYSPSDIGPIIHRCSAGGGDATWEGCYKNCNRLRSTESQLVTRGGIKNIHDQPSSRGDDSLEFNTNIIGNPLSIDAAPNQPRCTQDNLSCVPTTCQENYFKDDNHLLYQTCSGENNDGMSNIEVFLGDSSGDESIPDIHAVCLPGAFLPQKIIDNPRAYQISQGGNILTPLNQDTRINHFREDDYEITCNAGYGSDQDIMRFDRCSSGRNCQMSGTCSPVCNKPSDEDIANYEDTYLWESAPTNLLYHTVEYNNELLCSDDIDAEQGDRRSAKLYCDQNQREGEATYVATGCFPDHCKMIQERDGDDVTSSCIHRSAVLNVNTDTLDPDNMKICIGEEHDKILLGNSSPIYPPDENGISTGNDNLYGCSSGGFTELYNSLVRSIKTMGRMSDREDVHVNITRIQPLNTENSVTRVYVEYIMFCEGEECPKFIHEERIEPVIESPRTVNANIPMQQRPPPPPGAGK